MIFSVVFASFTYCLDAGIRTAHRLFSFAHGLIVSSLPVPSTAESSAASSTSTSIRDTSRQQHPVIQQTNSRAIRRQVKSLSIFLFLA
ncbi:unnamed protein product [Protopolystoma xenopodis]|uniref:Uncharacterized protein n=1 Tax=Protopolystoma xenopodis TaxID=117903 RepID=A0A3S5AK95_9PLAT|nr:unnamed protein product [Protopolystoma xenopodis]